MARGTKQDLHIVYRLVGIPLRRKERDLPNRDIDVSHIPLFELQRIFHAGPANQLLERRHVNDEKAHRLQSYLAEQVDTHAYRWEFYGRWSDDN
jgi:hypothetical protein